ITPVAAPTARVHVQSIPVVRSASEQADDFIAGLLRGLSADERLQGVAIAVVQDDHVVVERNAGTLNIATQIPAGQLRRVLSSQESSLGSRTTSVSELLRVVAALAKNGVAPGLAQMQRNGWSALQLDSSANGYSARLVIVPEAKLG